MKSATKLIVFLACSMAVLGAESPRGAPKREDMVGVWLPEVDALNEIEKRSPNRAFPTIELRSNCSFALENIPSWWRNVFGQPSGAVGGFSGGRWELRMGKDGAELLVYDSKKGFSMVLSIEGIKSPNSILLHIGGTPDGMPVRFLRSGRELNPPNQTLEPTAAAGRGSS